MEWGNGSGGFAEAGWSLSRPSWEPSANGGRGDSKLLLLQGHQGHLEGKNNRIKGIKRLGYGYSNADNLRIRIHLTNRSQWALT